MLIIDVRTPQEYAQGHLDGAILIEYQNIIDEITDYVDDKETPIGLYCAAGARSGIAAFMLAQHGYTHAVNLGAYSDLLQQYPKASLITEL